MQTNRFNPKAVFFVVILAGIFQSVPVFSQPKAAVEKNVVIIQADRTGQPISKYIYGQFIEHLGRCIYRGGIWAEMLNDRKFYHPVAAEKSPWKVVGPDDTVVMDRQNCYVGDHTPRVTVSGETGRGIVQEGLGLRKDKKYDGRIILAGSKKIKIRVSLVWGEGQNNRQTVTITSLGRKYKKFPLNFTAGADTDDARLEIVASGTGSFHIGTVSLMPADNIEGMRADVLKLLKELDSPIYRWPGGNFVSGYDWRDGIGIDRDKRRPRKNLAWNDDESSDFGIEEFMTLCRLLGTEPMMTVNSGFGDDYCAAQQVQYCNGGPHTPMGRLRAANGHAEPYNIKWWCVGNEMFGKWQLGYMDIKHYVIKHNLFAEAMLKADPTIKLITVGRIGPWSEKMLTDCAEQTDVISEHFYCNRDKESVVEYVQQIADRIRERTEAHRDYRKRLASLKGKDIPVAIDEWNYWGGKWPYNLKDAMGIAKGLHEMFRNSDIVFMANYAQTVNLLGAIKTNKTDALFETNGLVLKMYRRHFGTLPAAVTNNSEFLDVVAAWTADRKALTIGIVNPSDSRQILDVDLKGAEFSGTAELWQIADPDPMAGNVPGRPPVVQIEEKSLSAVGNELTVPPFSINIYVLTTTN
ncbi:MAG TPA: alpha-L-arabinofuranosidase C-terminal domain-containing protein [Sedimentisphaerales bacterium]|nr:alpha-L-arabinofuranosidase C-terminal domain-containing protein [Sedimentisphaerales bacterium]